jgi:predicted kinase
MNPKMLRERDAQRPEIIVMIGLPGSGKSTWRDRMLAQTDIDYVIVSSDDEIERLSEADGMDYTSGFGKHVGQATHIMKQKFREAVNNGKSIIWDQTNLTPKKRRGILRKVPDDYYKIAVSFEVDDQELEDRLAKRERETGKHIPAKVMGDMAKSYIPPTKQEGFDEVIFV